MVWNLANHVCLSACPNFLAFYFLNYILVQTRVHQCAFITVELTINKKIKTNQIRKIFFFFRIFEEKTMTQSFWYLSV